MENTGFVFGAAEGKKFSSFPKYLIEYGAPSTSSGHNEMAAVFFSLPRV